MERIETKVVQALPYVRTLGAVAACSMSFYRAYKMINELVLLGHFDEFSQGALLLAEVEVLDKVELLLWFGQFQRTLQMAAFFHHLRQEPNESHAKRCAVVATLFVSAITWIPCFQNYQRYSVYGLFDKVSVGSHLLPGYWYRWAGWISLGRSFVAIWAGNLVAHSAASLIYQYSVTHPDEVA